MNDAENRPNHSENPVSNQDEPEKLSRPGEAKRKVDRQYFEHVFKPNLRREIYRVEEDGMFREFASYEFVLDPTNPEERKEKISAFGLMALRAGYTQALGPVVIPHVGYRKDQPDKPLTSVYFFLEKPPQKPSPEE
jgi:hypothetical protein